jgi:exonuclease SbcD
MRILHTSDWHLGKRLYKLDRSPEHELFLDWLLKTLIDQKVDLLLIAGDIFDTPTPPHQSLELFYNFLYRVSKETKAEVFMIAGNHDSGLLLEAPAKILEGHRVRVWGKLSSSISDHWIRFQNIDICALPFFRSYELLADGEGDALSAIRNYITKPKERPQLLMLHHLAGIHEAGGSEQVITLSGVDSIPTEDLKIFDYVALGHIHKPQKIAPQSYYSGSPLLLRFSETTKKSVILIEEEAEQLHPRTLPIPVFRDFFTIKTNEKEYQSELENIQSTSTLTPMVEVQIELASPKVGLIDHIKEILQKKNMELLSYQPLFLTGEKKEKRSDKIFKLSPLELFEEFYMTKFPESEGLPVDLKEDFTKLLEKVKDAHSSPKN